MVRLYARTSVSATVMRVSTQLTYPSTSKYPTIDTTKLAALDSQPNVSNLKNRVIGETESDSEIWIPPTFTMKELRKSIPPKCFQRSLGKSFGYLLVDVVIVGSLFCLASQIASLSVAFIWKILVLWPVFWAMQGLFFFSLFAIGHECGHNAFSEYETVNNTVGFVLHSFLLVPYFSCKISHSKHHKHNAHMTKDAAFIPWRRSDFGGHSSNTCSKQEERKAVAPFKFMMEIAIRQILGWPLYLLFNIGGPHAKNKHPSHFNPVSPVVDGPKHAQQVLLSDIGILIMACILFGLIYNHGLAVAVKYYFIPLLVNNHWLAFVTFLHHTDVRVPHFTGNNYDFVKGALATVDRDYGWFLNAVFLHVYMIMTDAHVVHHLFPMIPHYHLVEATKHLKEQLGSFYISDNSNILWSYIHSLQTCRFVEDDGDVLWYKHK